MDQVTYNIKFNGIDIIEKIMSRIQIGVNPTFDFNTKVQLITDPSKKIIVVFVEVTIKKTNDTSLTARMLCGFGFEIENFESVIEKDSKGSSIIPIELENLLKTISISTMRGLMFSEFRGTQLHAAILPLILADSFQPISPEDGIIRRTDQSIGEQLENSMANNPIT